MKNKDDEIHRISIYVSAHVVSDTLESIKLRLREAVREELIDSELIFRVYGQVIHWITMDYVDRVIGDEFFDKKIEFIKSISNIGIETLKIREKERNKVFDS